MYVSVARRDQKHTARPILAKECSSLKDHVVSRCEMPMLSNSGVIIGRKDSDAVGIFDNTAVRLKVEQNQLVGVCGEIGVLVDALKGA